jgi:hypothetical protein
MKKIFLSLTVAMLAITSNAQTAKFAEFVYVTPERDTIFLDKNNPTSWNIYSSWSMDKSWKGVSPSIVFVDTAIIVAKKEEDLLATRRKNK